MSKKCAERTINIARQNCQKKTNLLVYEKQQPKSACESLPKMSSYQAPITHPILKKIRICTGAELKKMCAPPPCPCPPKKPGLSFLQMLAKMLGLGVKTLIALGAIYITNDMGIWGDSCTTRELYKTICEQFLPNCAEPKAATRKTSPSCEVESELFGIYKQDPCCDKFPVDHETAIFEMQQKWNKVIIGAFSAMAGLPYNVIDWGKCKFQKDCKQEEEDARDCVRCGEDD